MPAPYAVVPRTVQGPRDPWMSELAAAHPRHLHSHVSARTDPKSLAVAPTLCVLDHEEWRLRDFARHTRVPASEALIIVCPALCLSFRKRSTRLRVVLKATNASVVYVRSVSDSERALFIAHAYCSRLQVYYPKSLCSDSVVPKVQQVYGVAVKSHVRAVDVGWRSCLIQSLSSRRC